MDFDDPVIDADTFVGDVHSVEETRLERALRREKEARGCWGGDGRLLEVIRAVRVEEREKCKKRMAK